MKEKVDAAAQLKARYPAGIYRLRWNLKLRQPKGPAWYQAEVLDAGTLFLLRYGPDRQGQHEVGYIRPQGLSPELSSGDDAQLFHLLVSKLLRTTSSPDIEAALQAEGLLMGDLLSVLIEMGWEPLQLQGLLRRARQRSDSRRKRARLQKMRARYEEQVPGPAAGSAPREKTRPLSLAEQHGEATQPERKRPVRSASAIVVDTQAIEAFELIEGLGDPDQTAPHSAGPPSQSQTIQQRVSSQTLVQLAMPEDEKGENS